MMHFSEDEEISSLKVHEWLSVAVLIGLLLGLACLTSFKGKGEAGKFVSDSIRKYSGFDVLIKGAVNHPGIYHINSEITLEALLALADPLENADLRRFKLDALVRKGRIINIPSRSMLKVYLMGAVKEQTITVPKGSKLEDLIGLVEFASDADLNALKKKRRLKNEETIMVPKKL